MLPLFLAASLTLAQAGWEETARDNGCVFYKATTTEADGVQPVRATCDWPIKPKTLHRLLDKVEDHDLYFSGITKCNLIGHEGAVARTWQLHETPGMSAREVVLDMETTVIDGGWRFAWTKAADQSHNTGGGVEIELNTGMWEVTDNGQGGSKVVYELRYKPGGNVPGFMVRWFQGSGMQSLIGELRTYAKANPG
jgi:hypothetical protein